MKKTTDKPVPDLIVAHCVSAGIREVVLSPGSRNAPLVFAFAACPEIRCLTVVDERSAAFFALGMAQQLRRPVALVCTSGTAALNYAPALAEAYYQRIPLVAITADRPPEWIDRADGQAIRQNNLYANYIACSCTLPTDITNLSDKEQTSLLITKSLSVCLCENRPVHINVPLREPLYNRVESGKRKIENRKWKKENDRHFTLHSPLSTLHSAMILLGQMPPDPELNELLGKLAQLGVTVLSETVSNVQNPLFIGCIDRVLASISPEEETVFTPDLLITFDGQVTSKRIKEFLRRNKPREHWHVSPHAQHPDTYQCLTQSIYTSPKHFLKEIIRNFPSNPCSDYLVKWQNKSRLAAERHKAFIPAATWSDLRAFNCIAPAIPADTMLQLANSTPIRYAQLFEDFTRLTSFANRGTSGIDGSTSTAVGASVAANCPTLVITGDLSFLYDSNALWNKYLRPDFKIILINNGGGGIFRYISGAMAEEEMEDFFEARQKPVAIELLAKSFGLRYFECENETELLETMPAFFAENSCPSLLEVHTPRRNNAMVLKDYFQNLAQK